MSPSHSPVQRQRTLSISYFKDSSWGPVPLGNCRIFLFCKLVLNRNILYSVHRKRRVNITFFVDMAACHLVKFFWRLQETSPFVSRVYVEFQKIFPADPFPLLLLGRKIKTLLCSGVQYALLDRWTGIYILFTGSPAVLYDLLKQNISFTHPCSTKDAGNCRESVLPSVIAWYNISEGRMGLQGIVLQPLFSRISPFTLHFFSVILSTEHKHSKRC
jgi:hypothetical protein